MCPSNLSLSGIFWNPDVGNSFKKTKKSMVWDNIYTFFQNWYLLPFLQQKLIQGNTNEFDPLEYVNLLEEDVLNVDTFDINVRAYRT